MILFTKPKTEAGKGYLRVDRNLWYTTPPWASGKGARTGNASPAPIPAARILTSRTWSTNMTRNLSPRKKLGNFNVWHLKLTGKPGKDLAYPLVEFWVDETTGNDLKRQDFALSGRLMRTQLLAQMAEALQRKQESRSLVPAGNQDFRRNRQGQFHPGHYPVSGSVAFTGEYFHESLAGNQKPVKPRSNSPRRTRSSRSKTRNQILIFAADLRSRHGLTQIEMIFKNQKGKS